MVIAVTSRHDMWRWSMIMLYTDVRSYMVLIIEKSHPECMQYIHNSRGFGNLKER